MAFLIGQAEPNWTVQPAFAWRTVRSCAVDATARTRFALYSTKFGPERKRDHSQSWERMVLGFVDEDYGLAGATADLRVV